MTHIPYGITILTVVSSLAVALAVWSVVSRGASLSGLHEGAQRNVRIASAAFLGAWLGAALFLAPEPASLLARDPSYVTPLIPIFAVLSLTLAAVAWARSRSFRGVIGAIPLPALVGLQVWRIFGVVFLVLLGRNLLPSYFALPAGWGDIFVGATAPFVALALARRARGANALALTWNVFGLLDLFVAVGSGTGFLPSLLTGTRIPSAGLMGVFPMILIPAFIVPLSALLHIVSLSRLGRVHEPKHAALTAPAR